jgi:hypothetical protein
MEVFEKFGRKIPRGPLFKVQGSTRIAQLRSAGSARRTPSVASRWVSASNETSISGLGWNVKARNNEVRKRKARPKLHSWTPSLLQGSTSLPGASLTAKSRSMSAMNL